jgi:hypothetical protein
VVVYVAHAARLHVLQPVKFVLNLDLDSDLVRATCFPQVLLCHAKKAVHHCPGKCFLVAWPEDGLGGFACPDCSSLVNGSRRDREARPPSSSGRGSRGGASSPSLPDQDP